MIPFNKKINKFTDIKSKITFNETYVDINNTSNNYSAMKCNNLIIINLLTLTLKPVSDLNWHSIITFTPNTSLLINGIHLGLEYNVGQRHSILQQCYLSSVNNDNGTAFIQIQEPNAEQSNKVRQMCAQVICITR